MYQVLYRKWRPRIFEDVVGQPHVTVTLKNELKSNRINHAYLFTGSRGTGKTTCAKILAKAVNCLNPADGDPCCECEICKGIDEGSILDVSEIDAASNNGVDNIRSIIEEAAFTPARAKYRVYIIDEVHMLSAGAFNALLKTLEEPPAHVVFILATTEVHKLPATILSRCQRFDFHRIPSNDIADRLEFIAKQENVVIDRDAAMLIAAVSDGALRDAISLMDRCIGINSHITAQLVRKTAGIAGRGHLFEITNCIINNDISRMLDIVKELYNESKDMARLCSELTDHFRSLMLIKTMKAPESLLIMSDEEREQAKEQSKKLSLEEILYYMDVLQRSYDRMNRGSSKRTEIELSLVKLSSPSLDDSTEAVLARLSKLERAVKNGIVNVNTASNESNVQEVKAEDSLPITKEALPHTGSGMPAEAVQSTRQAKEVPQINEESKPVQQVDFNAIVHNAVPMDNWNEVIDILKNYSPTIAASFRDTDAYISGDYLLIDAKTDIPFKLLRQSAQRDKMRESVKEVTGRVYKLGPYKHIEENKETADPLKDFVQKVKASGVEFTEVSEES